MKLGVFERWTVTQKVFLDGRGAAFFFAKPQQMQRMVMVHSTRPPNMTSSPRLAPATSAAAAAASKSCARPPSVACQTNQAHWLPPYSVLRATCVTTPYKSADSQTEKAVGSGGKKRAAIFAARRECDANGRYSNHAILPLSFF
jgi:hypothetical protein